MITAEPESSDNVARALDQVQARLPEQLTAAEREAIAGKLNEIGDCIDRLRHFRLQNGDEPAPGFHPFRKVVSGS